MTSAEVPDHVFHRAAGRPVAVRASGSTIVTADGREILDGAAGAIACSIGHGHPEVIAAMSEQAARVSYVHAHSFETDALAKFAAHVAALVPIDGARVFPVSGGSEANESAITLARSYHLARGDADRHVVIARRGAYHGNSRGALDASHRAALTANYEPWLGQTARVPFVNPYRDARSGEEHAAEIDRVIREVGPSRVAAFVAEPISGATLAAVVPPDDYWPAVAEVLRRHGVLLIMDEVMTGFGRTGRWFASEHWDVVPDIVTAAKGVSGGYAPLAVLIATDEVVGELEAAGTPFVAGHTYSQNPVVAAAGIAVVSYIQKHGLVAAAAERGSQLLAGLRELVAKHPIAGEARGMGLMLGIELVSDQATKQPFPVEAGVAHRLARACIAEGVAVYPGQGGADGLVGDHVLVTPPMTITAGQVDELVAAIDRGLSRVERDLAGQAVELTTT